MLRAVTLLAAALLADAVIPDWDGIAPPARPTRLVLHAGAIYLGTEAGLYRRAGGDGRGWSLVAAAEPIVDLAPAGAELLIATPTHLYSCTGACERLWPCAEASPTQTMASRPFWQARTPCRWCRPSCGTGPHIWA